VAFFHREIVPMRLVLLSSLLSILLTSGAVAQGKTPAPACAPDDAGLQLPSGFCGIPFASGLGRVRHLAVAPNGDVFVASRGDSGGVVSLRDADGDGRAETVHRFGPGGGTGIALSADALYFALNDRVVRWPWAPGQLEPAGEPVTIIRDLPAAGNHGAKSIALGRDGALYLGIGSASNSCQEQNRADGSPGQDPCPELATRAGIWRFDASKADQHHDDGVRFATGLRNPTAIAVQPGKGVLYAAPHGRDQLGDNWGYADSLSAELPSEEFMAVAEGDDFGWPYCYNDHLQRRKVLAPEYGGDGKTVGRCAKARAPAIGFPGHWAPMAIAFQPSGAFGKDYAGGAFIAFHGSWNRAPLPQAGFRVVFVPFRDGKPTGAYSTFAARRGNPQGLRASGVAIGPDGSLYISDENAGTITRVVRRP
jgi:glucose/arabinose dehydrogenase